MDFRNKNLLLGLLALIKTSLFSIFRYYYQDVRHTTTEVNWNCDQFPLLKMWRVISFHLVSDHVMLTPIQDAGIKSVLQSQKWKIFTRFSHTATMQSHFEWTWSPSVKHFCREQVLFFFFLGHKTGFAIYYVVMEHYLCCKTDRKKLKAGL